MELQGRRSSYRRYVFRGTFLAIIFATGLMSGALLMRRGQLEAHDPPPPAPSLRDKLVGRWIGVGDGMPVIFHADGTYDAETSTTFPTGALPVPPLEMFETISGLYRWLDDEHIEIALPKSEGGQKVRLRIIIQEDKLTLITDDGEVLRGKRESRQVPPGGEGKRE
jgi:hypothetical protein